MRSRVPKCARSRSPTRGDAAANQAARVAGADPTEPGQTGARQTSRALCKHRVISGSANQNLLMRGTYRTLSDRQPWPACQHIDETAVSPVAARQQQAKQFVVICSAHFLPDSSNRPNSVFAVPDCNLSSDREGRRGKTCILSDCSVCSSHQHLHLYPLAPGPGCCLNTFMATKCYLGLTLSFGNPCPGPFLLSASARSVWSTLALPDLPTPTVASASLAHCWRACR